MPVKEQGGKWYVVKKNGKLGKRGYTTKTNALNAQRTARKNMGKTKGKSKKRSKKSGGGKTTKSTPKKDNGMNLNKARHLWGFAGAGVNRGLRYHYYGEKQALYQALNEYTAYDMQNRKIDLGPLVRGYGGVVNDAIETKVFRMAHINRPSSNPTNWGDALDYATYYGKTILETIENKDDPVKAHREAYKTQFGVDLNLPGGMAYQPLDMVVDKWLPYIVQRWGRKLLRKVM